VVTVAQLLGSDGKSVDRKARDTMYSYLHDKFRLGQNTGIELAGEQPGIIIPPTEQEGNAVRYSNMTFGQGMDLTMVQVAAAFCSLINGGTYYSPTVVAGTLSDTGVFTKAEQKKRYENVISPSSAKKIHSMIRKARLAFYAGNDVKGYDIGGKTGTSQTWKPGKGYTNDETIATYLGYGGNSEPRYVIMVETSGKDKYLEGNKHALPIFTDISNWLIDYLNLQPKR
jgi:cell division protein FtsI/penicillin-binding protein 2